MSETNGHHDHSEDAAPLTLDELYAATEEIVVLPKLSERLGKQVSVRHTVVSRSDWIGMLADTPPGSEDWPAKEWSDRETAWLKTLAPEVRADYHRAWADAAARVCVAAALEPKLSLTDARRLGEDMTVLYRSILRLSGLIKEEPAKSDQPPAEPDQPVEPDEKTSKPPAETPEPEPEPAKG
jgi:hypothetical protein